MYKLLCIRFKDILYNTGNIANVYNKWSTTLKNYKSLYCTLVTYNIVHQLYFSLKTKERGVYMASIPGFASLERRVGNALFFSSSSVNIFCTQ